MIQEQLAFLPESLPDYRPFPPAKERTAWQGLPLRAKQRFLQAGEAALQTPIAGDGLLLPPGAAVRVGKCRVCGARRALSG